MSLETTVKHQYRPTGLVFRFQLYVNSDKWIGEKVNEVSYL